MSDNYIQYSFVVPCANEGEAAILRKHLCRHGASVLTEEGCAVWVFDDDEGDVEATVEAIRRFIQETQRKTSIIIEYALTCSKPVPGEFGGGAVVIPPYQEGKDQPTPEWILPGKLAEDLAEEYNTLAIMKRLE